jgi:hypothetical protein
MTEEYQYFKDNPEYAMNWYKDSDKVSDRAREAVSVMTGLRLIYGYNDETIRPENKITRAEAYTLLTLFEFYLLNESGAGYGDASGSGIRLLKLSASNVSEYGFDLEFVVNAEAHNENAVLTYAYTTLPEFAPDNNTIKMRSSYLFSNTLRLSDITFVETIGNQSVYRTSAHAEFPNTFYVYAMLSSGEEYTDIVNCMVSEGLPSVDLDAPSYLNPDYGYNYNKALTLIDAVPRYINSEGRSFTLEINVGPDSDRDDTDVIVAWSADPLFVITQDNITSNMSGLTTQTIPLRLFSAGEVGDMQRLFSTVVTINSTGTFHVFVMLKNKTGVSQIIRRTVFLANLDPSPTPTPGAPATSPTPPPPPQPSPTPRPTPTPKPTPGPSPTAGPSPTP